jgi:Zn-dependent peptidase ImmA (M78 family)
MLSWVDAQRIAAIKAQHVHGDLKTPMDRPVDVFGAIEALGVMLAFAPLGGNAGMYLRPKEGPPGILIHEGHPRTKQRYTGGHELGHHVFEHTSEVDGDLETQLQRGEQERWPDDEKVAESFGAWFLMPRKLVKHALKEMDIGKPDGPLDVYRLSLWLGTSYTATARHLYAIKLAPKDRADEWAAIAPRELKRQLAGELAPDDMQNDVWWLDDRYDGLGIDARPGDRLILTLREIPSSGISWRLAELPQGCALVIDSFSEHFEPKILELEAEDDDPELAGQEVTHAFVLGVDADAPQGEGELRLVEDARWDDDPPTATFDLRLRVHPRLHGLLASESELALIG